MGGLGARLAALSRREQGLDSEPSRDVPAEDHVAPASEGEHASLGSFGERLRRVARVEAGAAEPRQSAALCAARPAGRDTGTDADAGTGYRLLLGVDEQAPWPRPDALRQALEVFGHVGTPVLFDIETTGLWGREVPTVALLGVAWPTAFGWRCEQWSLRGQTAERDMLDVALDHLASLLPRDAVVVTYNGSTFDHPVLRARSLRLGVQSDDALLGRPHLDLLPIVRTLFADELPDCRLSTLERVLLDVMRPGEISGAEVAEAYRRALAAPADRWSLAQVELAELHNRRDLQGLAALVPHIAQRWQQNDDRTALAVARLLLRRGSVAEAVRRLDAAWQRVVRPARTEHELQLALTLAEALRKLGVHDRAAQMWAQICRLQPDHPVACDALAKDLEHRQGRLADALAVAMRSARPCPRRIERLQRKLDRLALQRTGT